MDAPLTYLGNNFFFNRQTLVRLVDGFEAADWSRPASPNGGNNAHWILGHLTGTRRYLLRKLGVDVAQDDWEELFGMNAEPGDTDGYPTPEVLMADFHASGKRLTERLGELSADELGADWGSAFPDGGTTLGDGARFLYFHD